MVTVLVTVWSKPRNHLGRREKFEADLPGWVRLNISTTNQYFPLNLLKQDFILNSMDK